MKWRKKGGVYAAIVDSGRCYSLWPDFGNTWLLYHDFPTTEITGIPSLKEAKIRAEEIEKEWLTMDMKIRKRKVKQ